MIAQLMRTYPNTDWRNHDVVTMSMPRYMFYATQVTDKDIGGGAAARIDRAGHSLQFAGAGHPPAIVVTPGQTPRLLESQGPILGEFEDPWPHDAIAVTEVKPGDRVIIYTDGLTESFDTRRRMLDVDGLVKIVHDTAGLLLVQMKEEILSRVANWRSGGASDDISLLLLEVA